MANGAKSYFRESGEGNRFLLGSFLAFTLGNEQETGGLMEGVELHGADGSELPVHRHRDTHEALFLLEGNATLVLGEKSFHLHAGDYASIPPDTPHGFTFHGHRTRMLLWGFGGNGQSMFAAAGTPTETMVYPQSGSAPDWHALPAALDAVFETGNAAPSYPGEKRKLPPTDAVPYVLAAGEGEHMLAADQLFTFLTDQRQSGGKFICLLTDGPKGPWIPKHMHERHTETFYCLKGKLNMLANAETVELLPGDFLHVPAGTPHSFQLARNNTSFIGFLAPGLFEPFFRYLCDPCTQHMYVDPPPPFRFDRVIQHLGELDLKILERPGGPPPPPKDQP